MTIDKIVKNEQLPNKEAIKVPESTLEITAEWLNSVLFAGALDNKIASIEIDKNFGPASLLGKAVRVLIDYVDEESKPKSVIVKFQVSCSDKKRFISC